MGIFDSFVNKVKDDITWKAGQEVSSGMSKGVSKVFNREKKDITKCPKCKAKITSDLKFCPKCGEKLIVSCPKCEKEYPIGTKFCTECGKVLK
jgi:predicted RNA-binding Zn-ribbon protein involved in translation (DUF1610 family)